MAQVVILKITSAGSDITNFDIYSDADGFTTPFMEDIPKDILLAGFTSSIVPNGATQIRIQAVDVCSTDTTVPIDTSNPQPPSPVTDYWVLVPCEAGYPTYTTTIQPSVTDQRYIIPGTPNISYTWDNNSPTTFPPNPTNPNMQLVFGETGCPLCYVYEWVSNTSNTVAFSGTLCGGGAYSVSILPFSEGVTTCIEQLSPSTIAAYAALNVVLTEASQPCF
jgi:hypothetical protein